MGTTSLIHDNRPTNAAKPTGSLDARPASPTAPYDVTNDAFDVAPKDGASPLVEQLLLNHLRFAHAFRKNDAAMILQFLAKDVKLVSADGVQHEGQSSVLAYLVGARMTKISANLHVKGCPTRSGACQSTFVYEHGIVFKDPLYMEVVDWKPKSNTIVRIAHVPLPDAKSGKCLQEFGKSSPLRLSFGPRVSEGLKPIRKRKTVNPFVLLQCATTGAVWKSPVLRRDPNPKWNHVPMAIPINRVGDVVEISLWDHTFFRSIKVAGAALVVSDLLKDQAGFSTKIQLERFDAAAHAAGETQYVTLQLKFVQPCSDMAGRCSDEVGQSPTVGDEIELKKEHTVTTSTNSVLGASFKWLVVEPFVDFHHASTMLMLIRAAIVAVIVWMLFHATLVWPAQA
ncbi:hypothetical protein BBO99_00004870 [Phytophthora kernoviae]|uniref:C2 domain-containing protein n=2 Tax=Phytophthora kernoviae TaxID=325452 RepID=A0A3R7H0K5_9STRA|nr:hypothetical protein G195_010994 [Phytophthora kernoviae 00238/432]KAG2525076.1 hypothetical protein JM16_004697 [Phytophthora kernoviae]KAG2525474.1 hypothetical protein JM18_003560 [Phytophthora kernoviae]RLN02830.1 hypothetical protein BBI17_004973 [Phytophthora kernoviae]RLN79955.1 hypothetical protein BBO99_00004870 [Phytophthora kernoviae]